MVSRSAWSLFFSSYGCSVESHKNVAIIFFHRFYCALFPLICLACQHFDWDSRWKFPILFLLNCSTTAFQCCLIKCPADERLRLVSQVFQLTNGRQKFTSLFAHTWKSNLNKFQWTEALLCELLRCIAQWAPPKNINKLFIFQLISLLDLTFNFIISILFFLLCCSHPNFLFGRSRMHTSASGSLNFFARR